MMRLPAFLPPPLLPPRQPRASATSPRASYKPLASPLPRLDSLRLRLASAVARQDFRAAAALRDEVDSLEVVAAAAGACPRFAPGVVVEGCGGWRGVVVGCEGGFVRVAVDLADRERWGMSGGNVRVVREGEVRGVREGRVVEHPIVGTYFGRTVGVSDDGFLFYGRG